MLIAYYFPPDSSSGSFRPFHLANQLAYLGDSVSILTVKERHFLQDQTIDQELLKTLANGVNVVRCSAHRRILRTKNGLEARPFGRIMRVVGWASGPS